MNMNITKKLSLITKSAAYRHITELKITDSPLFIISLDNSDNFNNFIQYCKPVVMSICGSVRFLFKPADSASSNSNSDFNLSYNSETVRFLDSDLNLTEIDALYLLSFELAKFNIRNIIAISELCAYCLKLTNNPAEIIDFFKFNGIKPIKENIELMEKLASLDNSEKSMIIKLLISRDIAELLLLFNNVERQYFYNLFARHAFSLNNKKKLLTAAFDLINSGKLGFNELSTIIDKLSRQKNATDDLIIKSLNECLYPTLTQINSRLAEIIKCLNSAKFKFDYDKSLENTELLCKISINSSSELESITDELLSKNNLINEYFKVMNATTHYAIK